MRPESRAPFVDELMPVYDIESRHSTAVRATPAVTYAVARRLELGASPLIRVLFRLRGLPSPSLGARALSKLRFKPLIEEPPRGFVLGLIGEFWRPKGRLLDFEPAEFSVLQEPGVAKAVWSFDVAAREHGRSRLRTITRVQCTDDASRRRFLRYWRLIGPFSAVVRREALRVIRNEAEAGNRTE